MGPHQAPRHSVRSQQMNRLASCFTAQSFVMLPAVTELRSPKPQLRVFGLWPALDQAAEKVRASPSSAPGGTAYSTSKTFSTSLQYLKFFPPLQYRRLLTRGSASALLPYRRHHQVLHAFVAGGCLGLSSCCRKGARKLLRAGTADVK